MGSKQEEIVHIRNLGLNMDDGNECMAENVTFYSKLIIKTKKKWVWDGIDQQEKYIFRNEGDSMSGLYSRTLNGY